MREVFTDMAAGRIGPATALLWLLAAFVPSVLGGALAGVRLAGRDLGNELAAAMGAMFGPTAAVPAVLVGLIVLALV